MRIKFGDYHSEISLVWKSKLVMFTIIGLFLVEWVGAQSLRGVTNIRDTSFSTKKQRIKRLEN